MTQCVFDIERCFVDGRSGPIELGVSTLDELVRAHPPALDVRERDKDEIGSPFIAYRVSNGPQDFRLFSTDRSGRVTAIHIDLSGVDIRESRLDYPDWPDAELDCDPFRIRLNDHPVEHWASLLGAVTSGALEPSRLVALSSDVNPQLQILQVSSRLRGRLLHLAFEPRMLRHRSGHAGQVMFEYCIERVRLFA